MNNLEDFFGPVISRYTRAQAIDDGTLIDAGDAAREAGFTLPVALTAAAWAECVAMTDAAGTMGCDESGRLWDVLWMLHVAIVDLKTGKRRVLIEGSDSEIRFALHVVQQRQQADLVTLKAVCGPDDDGAPCLTVMLPQED